MINSIEACIFETIQNSVKFYAAQGILNFQKMKVVNVAADREHPIEDTEVVRVSEKYQNEESLNAEIAKIGFFKRHSPIYETLKLDVFPEYLSRVAKV